MCLVKISQNMSEHSTEEGSWFGSMQDPTWRAEPDFVEVHIGTSPSVSLQNPMNPPQLQRIINIEATVKCPGKFWTLDLSRALNWFEQIYTHVACVAAKNLGVFCWHMLAPSRQLRLSWLPTCQTEYWAFAALRSEPPQVLTVLPWATLDLSDSFCKHVPICSYHFLSPWFAQAAAVAFPCCSQFFPCIHIHLRILRLGPGSGGPRRLLHLERVLQDHQPLGTSFLLSLRIAHLHKHGSCSLTNSNSTMTKCSLYLTMLSAFPEWLRLGLLAR